MRPAWIAASLVVLAAQGWAQSDTRPKPASKPPAQKAQPPRPVANQAVRHAAPVRAEQPAAPLGQEELGIAQRVHQGHLSCELGASVRIEPDQAQPGYFNVLGKGFHYRMHPVVTSTGAIRLEDRQAGAVWLQLANKSMLMDQKKGQRLADDCAHPDQMAFAAQMKNNPPPPLIEVNTGR